MTKIIVHESLLTARSRAVQWRYDLPISALLNALESLKEQLDLWAVTPEGLEILAGTERNELMVPKDLVTAAMLCAARRGEVNENTRLRNALERLTVELDTWAINGSIKRRRRESCIRRHVKG